MSNKKMDEKIENSTATNTASNTKSNTKSNTDNHTSNSEAEKFQSKKFDAKKFEPKKFEAENLKAINSQSEKSEFTESEPTKSNSSKSRLATLIGGVFLGVLLTFMVGTGVCVMMLTNSPSSSNYREERLEEDQQTLEQIQNKATSNSATAYDKWNYSVILRDSEVRKMLAMDLSDEQASKQADEILQQAVNEGDPSAITDMGYRKILQALGSQVPNGNGDRYAKDSAYIDYTTLQVVDSNALDEGLSMLIQVQKTHCATYAEIIPSYPYDYAERSDNKIVGEFLGYLERKLVINYPPIMDKLDMIRLRNKQYCYYEGAGKDDIGEFLTDRVDELYLPYDELPVRQTVYLSVMAELFGLPELLPAFEHHVSDEDKASYQQQRQALITAYRQAYGDSVPVGRVE